MASVSKHGSGWRVRWREGGRGFPLHTRSAPSKSIALEIKRDVERNLALYGTGTAPSFGTAPYLHTRLRAWRDALVPRLRTRTVGQYQGAAEVLLDYLAAECDTDTEHVPISALNRDGLIGWYGWLVGHGRTRSTAAKRVHTLTLAWRWLYDGPDRAWLTPPPSEPLARTTRRDPPRAATWAQADSAVAACAHLPWLQRLAILARYTGLRRSELLLLRWEHIEGDAIHLPSGITKGGRAGRRVPISSHLADLLPSWPRVDGYVVDAPELERAAAKGQGRGHVDRNMRRAWMRAGVPRDVWHGRPLHGFRHVLETELLAAGARWEGVEALVGHVLPGTGGAHYAAARAVWPHMVEAVGLIPRLALPTEPGPAIPFPGSRVSQVCPDSV